MRDQAGPGLVHLRARLDAGEHTQAVHVRVRGDEGRPFHRDAERLFERPVEDLVACLVVEIRDQHAYWFAGCQPCWGSASAEPEPSDTGEQHRRRQRSNRNHPLRPMCDRLRRRRPPGVTGRVEGAQVCREFRRRLVTLRGIRLQAALDDAGDRFGDGGIDGAHRCRCLLHAAHDHGQRRFAGVRDPEEHLPDDQPEGVNVGACVHVRPARLLGRHVRQRAHHHSGGRSRDRTGHGAREAEIEDDGQLVGIDHHIAGFQITVHHARFVRGGQPRRDAPGKRQRARHRQSSLTTDPRRQALALDERHRQVLDAVDLAKIVDADDVPVSHLPREHGARA